MPDVIITYENLYELLRHEKMKPELQKVPDNFYIDVVKYLTEKSAILESQLKKESVFASTEVERTQLQLRNVQRILREWYERREGKIVQAALFGARIGTPQDTSTMLPQEVELYEALEQSLQQRREAILDAILRKEMPQMKTSEPQKVLKTEEETNEMRLEILEDIPEFVGPDLQIYGPYKKKQVIQVPLMIGSLLLQTRQAQNEDSKES